MASVTLLNWNVRRQHSATRSNGRLWQHILGRSPDLVCITEGHLPVDLVDWHWIASSEVAAPGMVGTNRKVLLGSRQPWADVDAHGHSDLPPGRYVAGRTNTEIGYLHVVGICIPWQHSRKASGHTAWEDHQSFINGLSEILASADAEHLVVVGDFNQAIPRTRAPRVVFDLLERVIINRLNVCTVGLTGDFGPIIDHVGLSRRFRIERVDVMPGRESDSSALSDHAGIVVKFGG